MAFFQQMIGALPAVATSWQAAIGYVALVVAFIVVSLKVTRNKNVLNKLKSLPEKDRARVLQMEMGAAYLAAGLSPEQWLQQQRQRFYFVGFLAVCVLAVALGLAATPPNLEGERERAERLAVDFVARLSAPHLGPAYDLFPVDVRKHLGFAQFQADTARLRFQLPGEPLKSSLEQSVDNGTILSVLVTSEFTVDTKVRNVVGLARAPNGWKLWQYNWQPFDWPLVWPTSTQIRQSASDAIKAYRALNKNERSSPLPDRFRGSITGSSPGWKLMVDSIRHEPDQSRCAVIATESESLTAVELKHVIGGCKLHKGARILVNAMLSAINDSRVELDGVRYFPDN